MTINDLYNLLKTATGKLRRRIMGAIANWWGPLGSGGATGTYERITWTTFSQTIDDRIIYVSSTDGNDAYNGLSSVPSGGGAGSPGPKRTINAAYSLMRDGYADWALLKKGDTWTELITLRRGGRSAAQPMLFGSYGTGARPIINVAAGTEAAFITGLPGWDGGPPTSTQAHNTAFIGLHIYGSGYTGSNQLNGITFQQYADNVLIEDCMFERLKTGVVLQLSDHDVTAGHISHNHAVRGCVFVDQFCTTNTSGGNGTAQGIFGGNAGETTNIDGLLMEFNIFDHNGWLDPIENPAAFLTWVRHSGYISNNILNCVLRHNIIMRSDGVMIRCGGSVENNFTLNCYGPNLTGQGTNPEPAGITIEVFNNVAIDGRDIIQAGTTTNVPGPLAMDIGNCASANIHDNIWAHNTSGTGAFGVRVWDNANTQGQTRTIDSGIFKSNIIYDWGGVGFSFDLVPGDTQASINIQDNVFDNALDNNLLISQSAAVTNGGNTSSGNHFYSQHVTGPIEQWFLVSGVTSTLAQWMLAMTPDDTTSVSGRVTFVDSTRTEATYDASIGGSGTRASFIAACRAQSKDTWDDRYTAPAINAYIRAGFTPV